MSKFLQRGIANLARPRLETHFYSHIADDLQVLLYNHDVVPNKFVPREVSMRDLFAVPLEQLPTRPLGSTVSSIDSVLPADPKPPRARKLREHPLDLLPPTQIEIKAPLLKPIETSYITPIPQLKKIVLKVLTYDAIGNK